MKKTLSEEIVRKIDELARKALNAMIANDFEAFESIMEEISVLSGESPEPEDGEKCDSAINNGGKTDYYQLPRDGSIRDFDDFAEWRGFNGNQFNIGKVFWTFNTGRHSGTDYVRDLNKIIHYSNREKNRVLKLGV